MVMVLVLVVVVVVVMTIVSAFGGWGDWGAIDGLFVYYDVSFVGFKVAGFSCSFVTSLSSC
jgi:hypothetical protein